MSDDRVSASSRRTTGLLAVCVGVSSLCFFANLPLVPLILNERDPERLSFVGVLVSVSFILSAALSPLWGHLADRYGPRIMIQRSAALVSVAYLVLAFAESYEVMLAARVINGLASGLIPAAYAYAVKSLPADVQGRGFTSLSAARSGGSIAGPAVVGLAAFVGSQGVLIAIAVLALTSVAVAAFLPRIPGTPLAPRRPDHEQSTTPARSRRLFLVLMAALLGFAMLAPALQTALPLSVAAVDPGLAYAVTGGTFAVAGLVSIVLARPWGVFIDRASTGPPAAIGVAGVVLALLLIASAAQLQAGPWALIVGYVLFCGAATAISSIGAIVNGALSGASGVGQGLQNSVLQAGAAAGPLFVGVFLADLSLYYWGLAGLAVLSGASLLVVVRRSTPAR